MKFRPSNTDRQPPDRSGKPGKPGKPAATPAASRWRWAPALLLALLLAGGLPTPAPAKSPAESAAESAAQSPAQSPATTPTAVASRAPGELLDFATEAAQARLARSTARADFAPLANQFEAQSNSLFCGPTSAAIVLNALHGRSAALPRERSRLRDGDTRYLPPQADPTVPRFTQDSVIERGAKTRAQVFGQPMTVGDKSIRDFGYQLHQLDEMLRANGARSRMVVVDAAKPEAEIRADLIGNLARGGDFVIVNYQRQAVGQPGGGHISPLAAYDAGSDSFLLLDVNPTVAGWVWMPAATLIRGMRTFDTVANRGYLLIAPP